jgi:hypothetical protein
MLNPTKSCSSGCAMPRSRMVDLAKWVEVPPEHVASGRTLPSPESKVMESFGFRPMIHVLHSEDKPEDVFVRVRYEGLWFHIPHEDFQ